MDDVAELTPEKNPLSLGHMMPSLERFRAECREFASSSTGSSPTSFNHLLSPMRR